MFEQMNGYLAKVKVITIHLQFFIFLLGWDCHRISTLQPK